MVESKNSLESREFIDGILDRHIYLHMFIRYLAKYSDDLPAQNIRVHLTPIAKEIIAEYGLKINPNDLLLQFLGEKIPQNDAWEVLESQREELFSLLQKQDTFHQKISQYDSKFTEFYYKIRYWLTWKKYASFDEAFDAFKDEYIPNLENIWLDQNKAIYLDLVAKFKVILRKKWIAYQNLGNVSWWVSRRGWQQRYGLAGTWWEEDNDED